MNFEPPKVRIPLCRPSMGGNESAYLEQCVRDNWVSSAGPFVERFERDITAYLGVDHAVALVNGTAALHLALIVAGVRPGDAVLTSTLTFVATANAIRHAGAWPIFIDADIETWQIDAARAVDFLKRHCERRGDDWVDSESGRRVGAVLPVHILGHPADMDPILEAAREVGIPVVEDATESLGARYKGRPVGSLGDAACLSFNGNKLITCGGGGMLLTNREDWARRARHLSTQAKVPGIELVHDEVGFNYRLTNLQAAVGCAQLETIDARLAAKRRIASFYRDLCAERPELTFMPEASWAESACWMSTVLVNAGEGGRRALMAGLAEWGIETRPLWQPLHLSPAHKGCGFLGGEIAGQLHDKAICLPSSCDLRGEDFARLHSAIFAGLDGAAEPG